jgi:hypothetical protein
VCESLSGFFTDFCKLVPISGLLLMPALQPSGMDRTVRLAAVVFIGILAPLGVALPFPAHSQGSVVVPASAPPVGGAEPQPILRYKVKVSEGTAWTNLQPESWLMFDVRGGNRVVARHSTFTLNAITGIGKWWDHPATEIRACHLSAGQGGEPVMGCVRGESPVPGAPLEVVLPEGTTLHNVLFRVRWQERGQQQEATVRVGAEARPTVIRRR